MPAPAILQHPLAPTRRVADLLPRSTFEAPGNVAAAPGRRRLWDLAPALHCSVIGTCLTTTELRQLFVKLGVADARSASDHSLHSRAVSSSGTGEFAGKMLHKALDKRNDSTLKRFASAKGTDEVRSLWKDCLERGDIPGAYWAVLTHPATDKPLLSDVFGDVHMLSHLVGMSNRADIARLRLLERSLAERDEKIARQQARLHEAAQEKAELTRRLEESETERRVALRATPSPSPELANEIERLREHVGDEHAHAATLQRRVEELTAALDEARQHALALEQETRAQAETIATLEALVEIPEDASPDIDVASLRDRTVLYVGGRPKLVEQLRQQVERRDGRFLAHDGGLEDKSSLLPGLVSQADAVYFPVDCVSHRAVEQVKRTCQQTGKPFYALRNASLASFLGALGAV
ncbi:DUF2325 domain-containing protein [Ancylobacter sp. Lp-2]|uniref:DUF2325 domain-containing protein n=1 Tax=Ancylobacter sp. Lp-2 TaxID=2881339 RepID=UPI001E33A5D3|nr:DUF2325 domain-containing protein [Ancylobacter sp. Lp-2]MCB4770425.1 DUF2325 domain-containing protein [Ancylobacter sp. Lp-2]